MTCLPATANPIKEGFSRRRSLCRRSASNTSLTENNNTLRSVTCSYLHSDFTRELQKKGRISQSSYFLASESSTNNARPRSNSFNGTDSGKNVVFSKLFSPATSEERKGVEFSTAASPIPPKSDFFTTSEIPKQDTFTLLADPSAKLDSFTKDTYPTSSDPFIYRDTKHFSAPPPDEFIPPDGGFGWVVAIAACLANIWIIGFIKSYSILYLEIKERFPDSTAYEASWIPVMLSTIGLLVSPLIGAMCSRYRVRTIASVGGFLCFLGIFLSAFATTLMQMVLTMGVLTGLGSGLVQTPSVLIVNMYFNKRRALASAICVSGNALGGFLIPPMMEYLLREYRLQGALLIAAALQLHILVSTFLYRPTRDHALIQARQRREEVRKEKLLQSESTISSKRRSSKSSFSKFGELDFTLKTTFKAPFEKVQTSLVLTKQDSEKYAISQELSIYRSMSLTESAPNLRPFSETSAQSTRKKVTNCKTNLVRPGTSDIGKVQCNECTIPLTGVHFFSKKPDRKRSSSESTAYEQNSTGTLKDFKPHLPKAQQQFPRKEPTTLQRFAVVNTATRKMKVVENSDGSVSFSDCDGMSFTSAMSPKRGNPLQGNRCDENQQLISANDLKPKNCTKGTSQQDSSFNHKENELDEKVKLSVSSKGSSKSNICLTIMKSCFDSEVLKTVSMILTCISSSLFALGAPHAFFYLHAYYTSVNVDSRVVTKLLSLSSIVDLSGRLIVGYVADMNVVRLSLLYFLCTGLAGTSVFCVPLVRSDAGIAVVLSGLGFGLGGFVVLLPTTLARNHGINKLSSSYSFVKMLHGSVNFVSPQVCGLMADLTGSYASVYYFMGSAMMLSSVLQKSRNPNKKAAENDA